MINIEITEEALAQLLDYTMTGMQELGEYTPTVTEAFKELVNKLPESAWNYETLREFADSLKNAGDEDYSFLIGDDDDDEYY